jgi:hypothetical protein
MVELRILNLQWGTVLAFLKLPPADGGEGTRNGGEVGVRARSHRARVDDLSRQWGCQGICKRQVSRLRTEIDVRPPIVAYRGAAKIRLRAADRPIATTPSR